MTHPKRTTPGSRRVALIGIVALVLAAPFGRWLGLDPMALALLLGTVAVMTIWVTARTVQAERRESAQD